MENPILSDDGVLVCDGKCLVGVERDIQRDETQFAVHGVFVGAQFSSFLSKDFGLKKMSLSFTFAAISF